MKQNIASVFFDILSYTIGNIIFCILKINNYNCKGIKTSAEANFLSCLCLILNFNLKWLQFQRNSISGNLPQWLLTAAYNAQWWRKCAEQRKRIGNSSKGVFGTIATRFPSPTLHIWPKDWIYFNWKKSTN